FDEPHTETAFSQISWRVENDKFIPRKRLWTHPLGFYGVGEPRPTDEVAPLYAALAESDFPTLYSSVRVEDDFAESFALYVHSVLLKQPYIVLVSGDHALFSCLEGKGCARKRELIAALFAH